METARSKAKVISKEKTGGIDGRATQIRRREGEMMSNDVSSDGKNTRGRLNPDRESQRK